MNSATTIGTQDNRVMHQVAIVRADVQRTSENVILRNPQCPKHSPPILLLRMAKFDLIVEQMKQRYDIRIKRWRTNMSGCAWRVYHHDGTVINWVESPYPKTPISLSIFLHEVGHHAIGFGTYKKRCEEEYHVWVWAIEQMIKLGVEPDARVKKRFELSMQYAVGKAMRRGIKTLPESLNQFLPQAA